MTISRYTLLDQPAELIPDSTGDYVNFTDFKAAEVIWQERLDEVLSLVRQGMRAWQAGEHGTAERLLTEALGLKPWEKA